MLGCLVHDLVSGLLKLVVLEVEDLAEAVGLLRVAVALEGVKDLRELGLTNDCVLKLSNCLICEDHVALVDAELERQEEHGHVYSLILANLHDLKLAGVGLRNKRRLALG